jgi:Family of unknown function (DUF6498)
MYGLLSASTLSLFVSPSALSLLAVNLGVIVFAVRDEWSLATILMSYLAQSVIIGIFQAVKISDLEVFSTAGFGFKINNRPVAPTPTVKWTVVLIFVVHYGFFQFFYYKFILEVLHVGTPSWPDVMLSGMAFFANHLFSYVMNQNHVARRIPNIKNMMVFPYVRILPMHAFIMAGAITAGQHFALVFFLILKTLADEATHAIEHCSDTLIG